MSEREFQEALKALLESAGYTDREDPVLDHLPELAPFTDSATTTYEEDGVLTMNAGLTVRLNSGPVFQLTIVQSR